jgi:hypothetical protein
MNTRALATSALLAGIALGACTPANETTGVALSAICSVTDDCKFAAKCDTQYIGAVVFDRSVAKQLWLPVQVNNALPNNADPSIGRLNTNDAHITSLEMTYERFALASASIAVSYTIPAGGQATVGIYVVPPQADLLTAPGAQVQSIARVVAKGYFEDGGSFETGEFLVPFTFCDACITYRCAAGEVAVASCPPGSLGTLPASYACTVP